MNIKISCVRFCPTQLKNNQIFPKVLGIVEMTINKRLKGGYVKSNRFSGAVNLVSSV